MTSKLKDIIGRNLRQPEATVIGRLVRRIVFEKRNAILATEAARLCGIQPDHQVLEVGFGPGIGIQAANHYVKDGKGKIFGADFSDEMVKSASKRLSNQIRDGKVELFNASVMDLGCFPSEMFDRVFHCNCYYFWPDIVQGTSELHRVMKPGAAMVTTMNPDFIKHLLSGGLMKYGNPNQSRYIQALETAGFHNVELKKLTHQNGMLDAIFAHKPQHKLYPYVSSVLAGVQWKSG